MNELRKQGSLCDVTLVAEGRQFPVHKVVLVSSSPYFRAMFNGTMSESSQELVNLPAVQSSALRQLIEYIYSGEVEVTEENVQSLLPAANLLQLSWVRDSCCRFLQSHLHPSNCLGIRSFGKLSIKILYLTVFKPTFIHVPIYSSQVPILQKKTSQKSSKAKSF
jgi:kelch-like protein 2/3